MPKVLDLYNKWKQFATEDMDLIQELDGMNGNEELINECFYQDLEFGTGGLRGVIGAGSNRMNIYTVQKATQGLADYLLSEYSAPSAAIAYDSRIKSDKFAEYAAGVLAANGIKVYIYRELMPTPALSFAVRHHKCDAGICITASHNPAKYNGYKVYGSDGCQITLEAANHILEKCSQVDTFEDVKSMDFKLAVDEGRIIYMEDDTVNAFLGKVKEQSLQPMAADLHVVYTPLNGAGRRSVLEILKEIGIKKVTVVKEQEMPDGNFTTCPYPNPEKEEALRLGLALCKEVDGDLLLATDPDCDRVGIAVKNDSDYVLLTGNEVGVLLLDYICKIRLENHTMPQNPVAVKTIVTTDMAEAVAKKYGVTVVNTLTGFKFIGEQIGILEAANEAERYIFGFEESYGYLSGTHVRDKDAVNASMLICEMAGYYKQQGITLVQQLNDLYKEFGYYKNLLLDFEFEGVKGMALMKELMDGLRSDTPKEISGIAVKGFSDYNTSVSREGDTEKEIQLPKSNVLEYRLNDGSKIIVRPSGTEPKIKIYLSVYGKEQDEAENKIVELTNSVKQLLRVDA